jgi:CheY-like chemotaxis protein
MSRFWRKLTTLFAFNKLPSTFEAATVFMPPSQIKTIFAESKDKREVFSHLAFALNTTESELLKDLSYRLGLNFSPTIPESVITTTLKHYASSPEAASLLDKLFSFGAVPDFSQLTSEDASSFTPSGFYCIDPSSLEPFRYLGKGKKLTFKISTWPILKHVIDNVSARLTEFDNPLALQVLFLILDEGRSYGSSIIEIYAQNEDLFYGFTTKDGREAKGNIHKSVYHNFFQLLTRYASEPDLTLRYNNVTISVLSSHPGRFLLGPKEFLQEEDLIRRKVINNLKPAAEKKWILVIEDNAFFAKVLQRYLTQVGFHIESLQDGARLLQYLGNIPRSPDLIICDVHLPGIPGETIVKMLKNHPLYQSIPIIMLSSDTTPESELDLIRAGAVAYIPKSKDPRILCAHIERMLE